MLQSQLFTKTLRQAPKDEASVNAQLLIRGGFIHKVMAGVYEYLPLGLLVLNKINQIIREEMNAVGGQELFMTSFQDPGVWSLTGRWVEAASTMYQFKDPVHLKDYGLAFTHEEPLSLAAKHFISSYKDLPKAVYQIQTKFRNEPRARSGLIRGREFLMKDLYSFHADEADLDQYYEKVADAYKKIFQRTSLNAVRTFASGGLFSKFSDEFQVITEVGEDTIYYCRSCSYSANKEVAGELKLKDECPNCRKELKEVKSIEVGNIFKLGTKFSEPLGLTYTDAEGRKKPVVMASYGIGPGRLMGVIVEKFHDDQGIIWPQAVSPFDLHLINIAKDAKKAEQIYKALQSQGVSVLFDQRDVSPGVKFADADLIGIAKRAVVSDKTLEKDSVELKARNSDKVEIIKIKDLARELKV